LSVSFQYDGSFYRARVVESRSKECRVFALKFFAFDESARRATNFYVCDSAEAAIGRSSGELRERVTGPYGVAPTIEFVEIVQRVDNSGSFSDPALSLA
jgi:hypothetical protein